MDLNSPLVSDMDCPLCLGNWEWSFYFQIQFWWINIKLCNRLVRLQSFVFPKRSYVSINSHETCGNIGGCNSWGHKPLGGSLIQSWVASPMRALRQDLWKRSKVWRGSKTLRCSDRRWSVVALSYIVWFWWRYLLCTTSCIRYMMMSNYNQ